MSPLLKGLSEQAAKLGSKAVDKLLEDPERAAGVAQVVGAVQSGKRQLDRAQKQVLNAMGFAHRDDYRDLDRRLSAARRRARHILERLDRLTGSPKEPVRKKG